MERVHWLVLGLVLDDGGAQAKLQLGLCSAEKRLVYLRVLGVEGDVGASAVGEALEDDVLVGRNVEELAELE